MRPWVSVGAGEADDMASADQFVSDLLVIGGGLAGERTAIEAARAGHHVVILSLVPPRRSHSAAAQGGAQAALGNCVMGRGDCPDIHFEDTVRGSDWGCEQTVARLFVEQAPAAIRQLDAWGVPWSRVESGSHKLADGTLIVEPKDREHLIAGRNFGGTSKWRTCYTADGTGHTLQYAVDSVVEKLGIAVHDRMEAISLIHDNVRCLGTVARCLRTGRLITYLAKATVIATGGCGRLYSASTNAVINEGTGMCLALDTGLVPLGNMEAVQFHPTGIIPSGILITEGARGDGGYLLDRNLHRFMPDYEPEKKELAFRDVVARRMASHMRKGYGVAGGYGPHLWLDIRHLGKEHIETRLQEIARICRTFNGIDPIHDLIPVRPVQHYTMGGVRTTIDGAAYGLDGLFAVGEAACWDLHGFNRLGGNSLSETLVAGMVVGRHLANYLKAVTLDAPQSIPESALKKMMRRIHTLQRRHSGPKVFNLLKQVQKIMTEHVGIFRHRKGLTKAVQALTELHAQSRKISLVSSGNWASPELTAALRLPGMIKLAICIAWGALSRTESRGSHFREDYPERDDVNWLKRTLVTWKEGRPSPALTYEPVTISELPPGNRG